MTDDQAGAATAAYFAHTADGPFDHQRDAYEQGYEDGRAQRNAECEAAELLSDQAYDYINDDLPVLLTEARAEGAATERERIRTELRNRAASKRDEAIKAPSNRAADRHIHAAAALDAVADLLDGAP